MFDIVLSENVLDMVFGGFLGIIGAIVRYARDINQEKDISFSFGGLLTVLIMGFGVGMIIASFIGKDVMYRHGMIIMFGFISDKFLNTIDDKSKQLIRKVFGRKLSLL